MKHIIITLLIALTFGSVAIASQLPDFPFVYAEGKAETNIAPDAAVIRLTISRYEETASNAVAVVEATGGKLIDTLIKKHGVSAADITADNINKSPVHRRGDNYELLEVIGYTVSRSVEVELSDIKAYPGVMRYVAELENVSNIYTDFKHSGKEEIDRALAGIACIKAKEKAELLAVASGVQLGGLFALTMDGFSSPAARFGYSWGSDNMYGDPLAGDVPIQVESKLPFFAPNTIKYEAVVSTIYKLQ